MRNGRWGKIPKDWELVEGGRKIWGEFIGGNRKLHPLYQSITFPNRILLKENPKFWFRNLYFVQLKREF